MSACDAVRPRLAALADGELAADERLVVESHLAGCEACRAALDHERDLLAAVALALPRDPAPPALRARIEALPLAATRRPVVGRWPSFVAGAALAASIVAVVFSLTLRERTRPAPLVSGPIQAPDVQREFTRLVADTHLRYARGQLPLEVRSTRPDEVSRFFAGRVPFHLALPDYPLSPGETKLYDLEGGRLVALAGDYAAYVAYRMDGRPISLLAASAETVHPEGRDTVDFGGLTFHMQSVAGLEIITWTDKGLTYALAADVAVGGARSCLVCHGTPKERRRIEGFGT